MGWNHVAQHSGFLDSNFFPWTLLTCGTNEEPMGKEFSTIFKHRQVVS